MKFHDLKDLIEYHEKKAKKLRPWNNFEDPSKIDEYYFHTRSVILLSDILSTYGENV